MLVEKAKEGKQEGAGIFKVTCLSSGATCITLT